MKRLLYFGVTVIVSALASLVFGAAFLAAVKGHPFLAGCAFTVGMKLVRA